MNPYIEKLNDFLKGQPKNSRFAEPESILEILQYHYILEHPVDSAVIRTQFSEVDSCLQRLPFEENNKLFALICDLCCEHAKDGFLKGLLTGIQLEQELLSSEQETIAVAEAIPHSTR